MTDTTLTKDQAVALLLRFATDGSLRMLFETSPYKPFSRLAHPLTLPN